MIDVRSFSTTSRPALRAAACGGRPRPADPTPLARLSRHVRIGRIAEVAGDITLTWIDEGIPRADACVGHAVGRRKHE
jgi:hypothetical protein